MDDQKRGQKKAVKIDLGIIVIITRGFKDSVFLAHNRGMVFSVVCAPDEPSELNINQRAYSYDERQWDEVFHAYVAWKRRTSPGFELPNHSGRRRDGKPHPWRWHPPT